MSKQTAKRDENGDVGSDFWIGLIVGLLMGLVFLLILRDKEEDLYRRAYSDAVRAATTCTEAMERVHEVCGSDEPSEQPTPPVFVPIPN